MSFLLLCLFFFGLLFIGFMDICSSVLSHFFMTKEVERPLKIKNVANQFSEIRLLHDDNSQKSTHILCL
jgi:hypothetical protein